MPLMMFTAVSLLLLLTAPLVLSVSLPANVPQPWCDRQAEQCQIHLVVAKQYTMMYYPSTGPMRPIIVNETGTYAKLPDCSGYELLDEDGKNIVKFGCYYCNYGNTIIKINLAVITVITQLQYKYRVRSKSGIRDMYIEAFYFKHNVHVFLSIHVL